MGLEKIDKNFVAENERNDGMVQYTLPCEKFDLHGVFYDEKEKRFLRMDFETGNAVSGSVGYGNIYTSGGRICFRTNSKKLELTSKRSDFGGGVREALLGSAGFILLEKTEKGEYLRATISPTPKDTEIFHGSATLSGEWKDYILYLPLFSDVEELTISLQGDASLETPKNYRNEKPIVYYGSSITHGGCASRPDTTYPAMISKWNDVDFVNLGFSGSALGEVAMAEYLSKQECSLFVCDYDHNAPSVEHLQKTHYRLYEIFRAKQKDTPVLFITMPNARRHKDSAARRAVIYDTYKRAKKSGDKNVYFLDGKSFYDDKDSELFSVDGVHPTDLGFYAMAKKIYAKMCKIDKKFR